MSDTKEIAQEREAFEHLMRSMGVGIAKTVGAWDWMIYDHSHVQALWDGWKYRADLVRTAAPVEAPGVLPTPPRAHMLVGRDLESLQVLYTAEQMQAYALALLESVGRQGQGHNADWCAGWNAHILATSRPAAPVEREASTPSSQWAKNGEPDPHAGHYDQERAQLTLGALTDDELANGAFMNYDRILSVQDLLNPKPGQHMPIVWMTAVKDRIRWLSRALSAALEQKP